MSMEICIEDQNLLIVRIGGVLHRAELATSQLAAAKIIRATGKVSALIVLDGFEGWEAKDQWGDVRFLFEHDSDIEKIAIVGEELWREEVLMFAGAGLRSTPVRYFHDSGRARAWLGEPTVAAALASSR